MNKKTNQRICVVGAGIAGLVTAKVLQADGFDVTVFDKEPSIGGVWTPSRTYPGLRTNGPRESYAFSDFPYPETADAFPTAAQVRNYLESYVDHFSLRDLICLSTEVMSISRAPVGSQSSHPGFQVVVRPANGSDAPETFHFDFVVVCNGVFSEPYLPYVEGKEQFSGQVLHSSHLTDAELLEGKRVVVVGAGKSALDCATLAAKRAQVCTIVFRKPHWMVPRYFFGIRMDRLLMTRFSELFLRYHRPSGLETFLHSVGTPFVRLFWRTQSWLITRLLRMPSELVPKQSLPMGFESVGVGGEFYKALQQEQVIPKQARITRFTNTASVELNTGEHIETDLVIFASGWRQDISFLDSALRNAIRKDGAFHLYRFILPPQEPHLGFIGYASSIASPFTSEIAAHWLSHAFQGRLTLPGTAEMELEIARVQQWSSEVFPERQEGYYIGPYVAHYVDELMRDMGLKTYRDHNLLTEYFARFLPRRYRGVGKERQQVREAA